MGYSTGKLRRTWMKKLVITVFLVIVFMRLCFAVSLQSTSFQVTATVNDVCHITTSPTILDVNFGVINPISTNPTNYYDATGSFGVSCTVGTPYTMGLSMGQNALGGVRRMSNGSTFLKYYLYRDAARSIPWDTGANTVLDTGTG